MEQHLKILGILNIVFGGLGLCGALVVLLVFGIPAGLVVADGDPDAAGTLSIFGVIGGFVVLLAAIFFGTSLSCRLRTYEIPGMGPDLDDRRVCAAPAQHSVWDGPGSVWTVGHVQGRNRDSEQGKEPGIRTGRNATGIRGQAPRPPNSGITN